MIYGFSCKHVSTEYHLINDQDYDYKNQRHKRICRLNNCEIKAGCPNCY